MMTKRGVGRDVFTDRSSAILREPQGPSLDDHFSQSARTYFSALRSFLKLSSSLEHFWRSRKSGSSRSTRSSWRNLSQLVSAQISPQSRILSLYTRAREIFTTPWRPTSPKSPATGVWSTWSSRGTWSSWRDLSPVSSASVLADLLSISSSLFTYACARNLYYAMASDFSKAASDLRLEHLE